MQSQNLSDKTCRSKRLHVKIHKVVAKCCYMLPRVVEEKTCQVKGRFNGMSDRHTCMILSVISVILYHFSQFHPIKPYQTCWGSCRWNFHANWHLVEFLGLSFETWWKNSKLPEIDRLRQSCHVMPCHAMQSNFRSFPIISNNPIGRDGLTNGHRLQDSSSLSSSLWFPWFPDVFVKCQWFLEDCELHLSDTCSGRGWWGWWGWGYKCTRSTAFNSPVLDHSISAIFQEKLGYNCSISVGNSSKIQLWKVAGCEHDPVSNNITGGPASSTRFCFPYFFDFGVRAKRRSGEAQFQDVELLVINTWHLSSGTVPMQNCQLGCWSWGISPRRIWVAAWWADIL